MSVQIVDRGTFQILGVMVETSLATAGQDISILEKQYEEYKPLLFAQQDNRGHYGLMWYTQDHRYCYLLGVTVGQMLAESDPLLCRQLPAARYAVMEVTGDQSVFAAWGEFFEKVLPSEGWAPDYEHGMFFEYYPDDGSNKCQLWTPVHPLQQNRYSFNIKSRSEISLLLIIQRNNLVSADYIVIQRQRFHRLV